MTVSEATPPPVAVVTTAFTNPRHEYVGPSETAVISLESAEGTDAGYLANLASDINDVVFGNEFDAVGVVLHELVSRFDLVAHKDRIEVVSHSRNGKLYTIGTSEREHDITVSEPAFEELATMLRAASGAVDISTAHYNAEDLLIEVW